MPSTVYRPSVNPGVGAPSGPSRRRERRQSVSIGWWRAHFGEAVSSALPGKSLSAGARPPAAAVSSAEARAATAATAMAGVDLGWETPVECADHAPNILLLERCDQPERHVAD